MAMLNNQRVFIYQCACPSQVPFDSKSRHYCINAIVKSVVSLFRTQDIEIYHNINGHFRNRLIGGTYHKAYFLGLNFREYPHNSYGRKMGYWWDGLFGSSGHKKWEHGRYISFGQRRD